MVDNDPRLACDCYACGSLTCISLFCCRWTDRLCFRRLLLIRRPDFSCDFCLLSTLRHYRSSNRNSDVAQRPFTAISNTDSGYDANASRLRIPNTVNFSVFRHRASYTELRSFCMIVPVIRLTDLGIRLVNVEVLEATAYGLTERQAYESSDPTHFPTSWLH